MAYAQHHNTKTSHGIIFVPILPLHSVVSSGDESPLHLSIDLGLSDEEMTTPGSTSYLTRVELLQQIADEITTLETRLDEDEEIPPVLGDCVERALDFVHLLRFEATKTVELWTRPTVSVTMDGGVRLYWYTYDKQISLAFREGHSGIDVQTLTGKEGRFRQTLPLYEAVPYALAGLTGE